MQSIIMLFLFIGMFLVVQSVYEDRIRQLETAVAKQPQSNLKMYEPVQTLDEHPLYASPFT